MTVAMSESLTLAALGAGAVLLLIVTIFGMIWPAFMAWAAHFVTVVTGFAVIAVLIYGVGEYRELRADLRVFRAAVSGDTSGLTARDRQRYPNIADPAGFLERLKRSEE
jgi:hypothetical protein